MVPLREVSIYVPRHIHLPAYRGEVFTISTITTVVGVVGKPSEGGAGRGGLNYFVRKDSKSRRESSELKLNLR